MKCGINRDWLEYLVQFVQRGESYLDLNRRNNRKQEINQMNQRSPAHHMESVSIIRSVYEKDLYCTNTIINKNLINRK